ncbi:MAG: CARDB domain-containing protein [Lysobacterales bacterium]
MSAPFGFSRLATLLATLFALLALATPAAAQIGFGPQLSLSPTAATGAGTISVAGDRLTVGADYEVRLRNGGLGVVLAAVANGDGDFQRFVTLPTLVVGTYPIELSVNRVLRDTVTLRVLAPLAITLTPASPRAGTTLRFTVTGLTSGSLSMTYAGRNAFGPVTVTGTSYSGQMRVPTDRPTTFPASVVLTANNSTGRGLVPRRGSRTLTVQPANLSPLARVMNATPSTFTPTPRQTLRVTGSVATNEANPADVTVEHFWTGSDGRVMPMGASVGAVGTSGAFDYGMLTPQHGSMSARQVTGGGRLSTRTRYTDDNGVRQYGTDNSNDFSLSVAGETNQTAEISITLAPQGGGSTRIEGARIDLLDADLEELYPPNSNQGGVPLEGTRHTLLPNQYQGSAFNAALNGCVPNVTRQFTNAGGQAQFNFGLDLPGDEVYLPGETVAPRATIVPTVLCAPGPDINTPGHCATVDLAAITFKLRIRAVHTGYGYQTGVGTPQVREAPIEIETRIDRYSGAIRMTILRPGSAPEVRTFQNQAALFLTLPQLANAGLSLSAPQFANVGFTEQAIQVEESQGLLTVFKPMTDLSSFRYPEAEFIPADPTTRTISFGFDAGAGRPLASATAVFFFNGTEVRTPMQRVSGSYSCDTASNPESWQVALPSQINRGFRFPGEIYNNGNALTASKFVFGNVEAVDTLGRRGVSNFKLQFEPLKSPFTALVGQPARIYTKMPHSRRLETMREVNGSNVAESPAVPEYDIGAKTSRVDGGSGYGYCIPSGVCEAVTAVEFDNRQFGRVPESQGANAAANEAGVIQECTGASCGNPWEELFKVTIPLFKWIWGIPELLSAEVYADLALSAEYMLVAQYAPLLPAEAKVDSGGRFNIGIFVGVDIDVLFGILLDAGASIYGGAAAEVVTETTFNGVATYPCLKFIMNFSGWLEIGCPIPNPLDPTCYIPDIEENYTILDERDPNGCGFHGYGQSRASFAELAPLPAPLLGWPQVPSDPATTPHMRGAAPPGASVLFPRAMRRALHRSPAIAMDGAGNRIIMNLNSNGSLVAREFSGRTLVGPVQTVSTGFGIRNVAVAYYSTDRAVAVWSESRALPVPAGAPPPRPTRNSAAADQRLRYALYDGDAWSAPNNLTAGGFGDGLVKLARCRPRPTLLRADCQTEKVALAFQRNTGRTVGGEKHIFFSTFDGARFTAPVQVDQTGTLNITPSITYAAAEPVIAWVRYQPTTVGIPVALSDTVRRTLAMRVMDGSPEQINVGGSMRSVAQPSIAGKANGQIAIAFTQASTSSFIGTRQALHVGQCPAGRTCALQTWRAQDQHGRNIFVERPTVNLNSAGDAIVTYRGLAYGPVPGAIDPEKNLFDDDPIGIRTTSGELMDFVTPLQPSTVRPRALSADGAIHFQSAAVFDPVSEENIAVGVTVQLEQMRIAMADAPPAAVRAVAQAMQVEEGIDMATIADAPDLFIETLASPATRLDPGTNIPVTVTIANHGSAWTTSTTQTATLRLWWDTPQTRTVTSASTPIGNIAAGASLVRTLQIPVPAAFANDERQTLRAVIELDADSGETDGDNNEATLAIGGMPVPTSLVAVSAAGTRFVNLGWAAPTDARIAGYRIYADFAGEPRPLGSSFNKGFVDLAALFGRQRTYRVTTYSTRGVESEFSAPVTAGPAPEPLSEALFADGFELQ